MPFARRPAPCGRFASGWSTGKKTVDSRLSQGPSSGDTVPGEDYETMLEKYKEQGKRTGNVSSGRTRPTESGETGP